MFSILRKLKIRQRGLSKYCPARAFLDTELKRNAFKPRLRFIEKNSEINYNDQIKFESSEKYNLILRYRPNIKKVPPYFISLIHQA